MKNANDIIPAARKLAICIVEVLAAELLLLLLLLLPPLPISKYVTRSRNDVIVTASVIAPFTSTVGLLVADLPLFDIVVSFLLTNSELFLRSVGSVSSCCC